MKCGYCNDDAVFVVHSADQPDFPVCAGHLLYEVQERGHRCEVTRLQLCGHPRSAIRSTDDGTAYCAMCEKEARDV